MEPRKSKRLPATPAMRFLGKRSKRIVVDLWMLKGIKVDAAAE
jgi:hypothetical protein